MAHIGILELQTNSPGPVVLWSAGCTRLDAQPLVSGPHRAGTTAAYTLPSSSDRTLATAWALQHSGKPVPYEVP